MATRQERWANALWRAQQEHVRPISLGHGRYLVASSTVPGVGYLVDVLADGRLVCTCPAGEWRFPCKHSASVYLMRQHDGAQTRERAIVTG